MGAKNIRKYITVPNYAPLWAMKRYFLVDHGPLKEPVLTPLDAIRELLLQRGKEAVEVYEVVRTETGFSDPVRLTLENYGLPYEQILLGGRIESGAGLVPAENTNAPIAPTMVQVPKNADIKLPFPDEVLKDNETHANAVAKNQTTVEKKDDAAASEDVKDTGAGAAPNGSDRLTNEAPAPSEEPVERANISNSNEEESDEGSVEDEQIVPPDTNEDNDPRFANLTPKQRKKLRQRLAREKQEAERKDDEENPGSVEDTGNIN